MQPISTTTCEYGGALHWHNHGGTGALDPLDNNDPNGTSFQFSTSTCVTYEPTSATGTPAVLWHYDAGELMIIFVLVAMIGITLFGALAKIFYANTQ